MQFNGIEVLVVVELVDAVDVDVEDDAEVVELERVDEDVVVDVLEETDVDDVVLVIVDVVEDVVLVVIILSVAQTGYLSAVDISSPSALSPQYLTTLSCSL